MVFLPSPPADLDATPLWLIPQKDAMATVEALVPAAADIANLAQFRGKLGAVVPTPAGVLVGLGDGRDPLALGAASAVLPEGVYKIAHRPEDFRADLAALGWGLGAYRFTKYRTGKPAPTLALEPGVPAQETADQIDAVTLVRDLVNTPTEDMGPNEVEAAAADLAAKTGATLNVTSGNELAAGFPLIHAVGRAAATAPRLIDLELGPVDAPSLTLVGKGVCFDSGGLNIKGGKGMALMKKDMCGAANVLGLAKMIMAAALPIRLRVLIPAVENAISGNAFRPGDVFRARNGTTVEISNTDAEGRLILCDALALAAEAEPDRIISLATLTGAARVALGPDVMPVYSTDRRFRKSLVAAGEEVADPLWPMPFWSRYLDYLKSDIADIDHAGGSGFAGSITAALFLKEFVPETVPYTHLDIYAWTPTARPGRPKGGEAMGIRAIFDVLRKS